MFLGIAEFQINKLDQAEAALNAEVALQPKNVEVLSWLGIIELGAGHANKAAAALDRAAELSPKDANILYYQGRAHSLIAQQAYQALYRIDPDSWLVHRALGENYSESGQPEKAIEEFEAAIRKQPNNSDLYEALGEANQRMSRFDEAIPRPEFRCCARRARLMQTLRQRTFILAPDWLPWGRTRRLSTGCRRRSRTIPPTSSSRAITTSWCACTRSWGTRTRRNGLRRN